MPTLDGPSVVKPLRPAEPLKMRYVGIATLWVTFYAASLVTGIFLAQLFAGLGGLLAIVIYRRRGAGKLHWHPASWATMAVVGIGLMSALLSERPLFSLGHAFRNFTLPALGFYATLLLARSQVVRKRGIQVLLIAGVVSSLYALFQHLTGTDPLYGQEIKGPIHGSTIIPLYGPKGLLNNTLTYAGVQVTILLFLLPTAWRNRTLKGWPYWTGILVLFMSIFITYKRGPLLALLAVTGLFFMTRSKKAAVITILGGLVMLTGLYFAAPELRARVQSAVNLESSSETDRLYLWDASWRIGLDHPVLGVGPGLWRDYIRDYIPQDREFESLAHPHSDPFYVWSTSGFLGTLATLALYGLLLWRGRKELWKWKGEMPERDLYSGGVLTLAGFGILGLFQCYLIDGENMLMLGYLLGLALAGREMWLRSELVELTGDRRYARK
ncbi:O-antigen ligase family protein [bacterium]|nr:O-antigen ligase family protein [bacterium]